MIKSNLVTGSAGFFGRIVTASLSEAGFPVTGLDRVSAGLSDEVTGDLCAPSLDLGGRRFESVFHLAGLAHFVPRTKEEADSFFRVNLEGTRNLLRALEKQGSLPESFVLVSTVAVYGVEEGEDMTEEQPVNPVTPYGESKAGAEALVTAWGRERGVRTGIVRPPLLAGPNPPGNLGAMIRAIKTRRYLGIGDGNVRKSMVMADDIARVFPAVAGAGGVYHLTDGIHPTFRELEAGIAKQLGMSPPPRLPKPAALSLAKGFDLLGKASGRRMPFDSNVYRKMTRPLTFSDRKARETLGWAPSSVLERLGGVVVR